MTWLGVDVGGPRKGFDVALIDDGALRLLARLDRRGVVALVESARPRLIGIDSPRSCAPAGATSRDGERALARAVCGIRWTPDRLIGPYYSWIVEGLGLYHALAAHEVIEVFPTASWTRWLGPRGAESRAAWSRHGLDALGLAGVPAITNQDQRDAIAAAVTAREHSQGRTEAFGEIVVPASGQNGAMAYDEALADRVRGVIQARGDAAERKMFGGITWMLQGNMACGVLGADVCVRLRPEDADRALEEPGIRRFEMMAGRPSRGFIVVAGETVQTDDALARWVNAGADYALSLPPK